MYQWLLFNMGIRKDDRLTPLLPALHAPSTTKTTQYGERLGLGWFIGPAGQHRSERTARSMASKVLLRSYRAPIRAKLRRRPALLFSSTPAASSESSSQKTWSLRRADE
jgi:hypothetical protein